MPPNDMPAKDTSGITGVKRYLPGSARSQQRLSQLKHDPILKQVKLYWKLEAEVRRLEEIRENPNSQKVYLDENGKPRMFKYSSDQHVRLLEQMSKINEGLMRYGYGRVPELENTNPDSVPTLTINLTQAPTGVYEDTGRIVDVNPTPSGAK